MNAERSDMLDEPGGEIITMADREAPIFRAYLESAGSEILEVHTRHNPHDRAHVNLMQDEYTPQEVAHMLGTSLEVVMRAIWHRELQAERKGQNIICIPHAALTTWLHSLDRVA